MQTEIAQTIFEKAKVLSADEQQEALNFIEKLSRRKNKPRLKIFAKIDEIVAQKPPEIWDEVPTDSSVNVDRYLYGADKK